MKPPIDAIPIRHREDASTRDLTATQTDHHTRLVTNNETMHWVWTNGELASCDCGDFIWRSRTCKHITCVEEGRG